jgi:hypothetical protein
MNYMICLSKNLSDEYINMYAKGAKLTVYDYDFNHSGKDILIRSLAKRKLIWECLEKQQTFYYMDSGYVGNYKSEINPYGWKLYHRIVKNGLQHNEIIERPNDRWERLKTKIHSRKKGGNHILLVTPSEKPCKFYGIDLEQWKQETINQIKMYTDRPIVIREKQPRFQRLRKTIYDDLDNAHALVTYNSIAAIESVLYGIPAFTLAPTAADPVANKNLWDLEKPQHLDKDYIYSWACHLAYGQFHIDEFKNGTAHRILLEEKYGN